METTHDVGPLRSLKTSLGTSARPMKPAIKPRMSAPITATLLSGKGYGLPAL
jgi:hypothetical protein